MLAAGADKEANDQRGQTPLMWACYEARSGAVEALIVAGANVCAENDSGTTVLHNACNASSLGRVEVVRAPLLAACSGSFGVILLRV